MRIKEYDRKSAIEYAKKWAYLRNPKYYNFDPVGGDCTSFASQCIYEGSKVMNYDKQKGWYYINGNNKSPSWTGVEFLYKFLVDNKGIGPFGKIVDINDIELGDIAQISFDGKKFAHSLVIIEIGNIPRLDNILIAAHTFDTLNKQISEYNYKKIRFIHINEVRV